MSPTPIPFGDLKRRTRALQAELEAAARRVLESGWFILGPEVEAFEAEFAAWIGARYAVGVGSGTDALALALRALGIGPGDEVITTAMSAAFTALAISLVGATPVFVDIDPETGNLDPAAVEAAVTPRTRAIVPVHLYGRPADLEPLLATARRHGLALVEDCAQAHGARYRGRPVGTWGVAGAFSFYPTKNLGALGDGGAVVTDDPELAERIRRLRDGGQAGRYEHVELGMNSRLDALQAAFLRTFLPHVEAWNARRRRIAARYRAGLADLPGVELLAPPPEDVEEVVHLFAVLVDDREGLRSFLRERGIGTGIHYPRPIPHQPAYASLGHRPGDFPAAEAFAARTLSLPCYPELTDEEVDQVIAAIRAWARGERER